MIKLAKKLVYYATLVGPLYKFLRDWGYAFYCVYINHQQELETAKMNAKFRSDSLQNISLEEFEKLRQQINERKK